MYLPDINDSIQSQSDIRATSIECELKGIEGKQEVL